MDLIVFKLSGDSLDNSSPLSRTDGPNPKIPLVAGNPEATLLIASLASCAISEFSPFFCYF